VCSRHGAPHQSLQAARPGEPAEYRLTLAPLAPLFYISLCIIASAIYKAFTRRTAEELPAGDPAAVDAAAAVAQQLGINGSSSTVRSTEPTAPSPTAYDENAVVDVESRVLGGGSGGASAAEPPAEANIGRLVVCAQLPQQQRDEQQLKRQYERALQAFREAVPASKQPTGFILVYPR
jgi:hypothetical protein